jgi:hypothetical protein
MGRDVGRLVFQHGIGGSQDLPISLPLALAGGSAALTVSFVVLALAWRRPRYDAAHQGRPLPAGLARVLDGRPLAVALRLLGLLFTGYVAWAAVAGPDNLANPTFGVVYVWLWVGLVPASLVLGPVVRALSPVRSVHWVLSRVAGGDTATGLAALPRWVGLWPAALGLFAFVWLELVYPESNYLSSLRIWFAVYVAVVLVGAAVFGDRWIAAADPFEVYSTLVSHLGVVGRRADGVLVWRSPLANLDGVPALPGLTAVTSVLLGSTAWDSYADSIGWVRFSQDLTLDLVVVETAGLLALCLAVGLLFSAATWAMATSRSNPGRAANVFAHSLVPIVVGYIVAHYLSYGVEIGQQTLIRLSDPMVEGADLLGTADLQVSYWLTEHPTFLATVKVLAIVLGHVVGVVAAHDRALKVLPPHRRLTGQLPLLLVMILFTVSGLYLLLTV